MNLLPFPVDPQAFALWLGTATAAGVIVSLLIERLSFFQGLTPQSKARVTLLIFLSLPVLSVLAQQQMGLLAEAIPLGLVQAVTYILGLLLQGLAAWSASQFAHKHDPQTEKRSQLTL